MQWLDFYDGIIVRYTRGQLAGAPPDEHVALRPVCLYAARLDLIDMDTAFHALAVIALHQHTLALAHMQRDSVFCRDQQRVASSSVEIVFFGVNQTVELL